MVMYFRTCPGRVRFGGGTILFAGKGLEAGNGEQSSEQNATLQSTDPSFSFSLVSIFVTHTLSLTSTFLSLIDSIWKRVECVYATIVGTFSVRWMPVGTWPFLRYFISVHCFIARSVASGQEYFSLSFPYDRLLYHRRWGLPPAQINIIGCHLPYPPHSHLPPRQVFLLPLHPRLFYLTYYCRALVFLLVWLALPPQVRPRTNGLHPNPNPRCWWSGHRTTGSR